MQMIYLSRKDVEDLNITMKEILVAVDDMVTAKVLYERAIKTGAGVRLPLWRISTVIPLDLPDNRRQSIKKERFWSGLVIFFGASADFPMIRQPMDVTRHKILIPPGFRPLPRD